jgi:hypothetical protein
MATTILNAALTASIRTLLNVDAETLSDATLMDPLLGEAVEMEILETVGLPLFADRPAGQQLRITQAIAFETAARALETGGLREELALASERISDQYQMQRNATEIDRKGWVNRLRLQAREALAPLMEVKPTFLGMFAVARCGRGR